MFLKSENTESSKNASLKTLGYMELELLQLVGGLIGGNLCVEFPNGFANKYSYFH